MNVLKIKNLTKVYPGGAQALKEVNINVKQGEFLVLLGLSGSGKSTLLRCINGLIPATDGHVEFMEEDITNAKGKQLRFLRRQIGMIYQQFNLIKNMSSLHNVISGYLGYMNLGKSIMPIIDRDLVEKAELNLKRVGLGDFSKKKVKFLSGGQQQRVAIARALMQNPKLILADEPVASLDPATADSVMQYLGELNKKDGITVVCSLHFLSLARKYGTRVIALKGGEVVFSGIPSEITPERFKEIYGENAEEMEII